MAGRFCGCDPTVCVWLFFSNYVEINPATPVRTISRRSATSSAGFPIRIRDASFPASPRQRAGRPQPVSHRRLSYRRCWCCLRQKPSLGRVVICCPRHDADPRPKGTLDRHADNIRSRLGAVGRNGAHKNTIGSIRARPIFEFVRLALRCGAFLFACHPFDKPRPYGC